MEFGQYYLKLQVGLMTRVRAVLIDALLLVLLTQMVIGNVVSRIGLV